MALVGGRVFTGLVDLTADVTALDSHGLWVVVLPFTGPPVCARFLASGGAPAPPGAVPLPRAGTPPARPPRLGGGPAPPGAVPLPRAGTPPARPPRLGGAPAPPGAVPGIGPFTSSLDRAGFCDRVSDIREAIAAGDVYQVNLCRRLQSPWSPDADIADLGLRLALEHPSSHSAVVRLPSAGVHIASASPECFLRREGPIVESRPIKGTAARAEELLAKDRAENVMIVDLVRNDLGRVCEYGSVSVPRLCEVERNPGLVHLVSTVRGRLREGVGWAELLDATFPPGSVTGAPKLAAVGIIDRLETVPRGIYCGAVGWVDADARRGDLNVAIRTFWLEEGNLCFGTGGGITWGSSPESEWEETELKARRLLDVARRELGRATAAGSGYRAPAAAGALIDNLAVG